MCRVGAFRSRSEMGPLDMLGSPFERFACPDVSVAIEDVTDKVYVPDIECRADLR
jgi:hypothetical protein